MNTARFNKESQSPLKGVSNRAWMRFLLALEVQAPTAISKSGGYGAYDMRPMRLVELGYATKLKQSRKGNRQVQSCVFILPYTEKRFLTDITVQFDALSKSISMYHQELMSGKLKVPEGVSMSGALAILHRGGEGALKSWPELFTDTRALYERAKGIF